MSYSDKECVEALQKAQSQIEDEILSSTEYRKIRNNKMPSVSTLSNRYGGWNEAKKIAGLNTITDREAYKKQDNPTNFEDIPEDENYSLEEWKNLSKPQRYYYRNKDKIKEKASEHKKKQINKSKEWIEKYKEEQKCERCGENRSKALQFHHKEPSKKGKQVSRLVSNGVTIERIKEEIEKCEVICANCHQIHHIENGFKE